MSDQWAASAATPPPPGAGPTGQAGQTGQHPQVPPEAPQPPPQTYVQPGSGASIPSPFVAVVGYTLRACLPPRRWAGVLLVCVGGLLLALITQAVEESDKVEAFGAIASFGLFSLILPFVSLVIGDAVLGADARAGTFQLTWLSPVNFATVAFGRWLGGWIVALVTVVPAFFLSAIVAGQAEAAGPMAIAAAAGSAAYIALFLLLGVLVKRSTVWALAIVFVGEWLVGGSLSGVAQISPLWEAQKTYIGLWDEGRRQLTFQSTDDFVREGMPHGWAAVTRLVIIGVICLGVATWRLARMRPLSGDD
jgi:ABC-type transport system involved in multi-copper enzyme maturation permease subunit